MFYVILVLDDVVNGGEIVMPVTHVSHTVSVETHAGLTPRLVTEMEPGHRRVTRVLQESSLDVLATVSQAENATTQVHFLKAKGGFFAIVQTEALTYLALPGSQLQLPDTLLNLPGDLPPGRLNPGSSSSKNMQPQQVTDQAMILGAGLASRFVPVSGDLTGYAKPSVPLLGEDSVIVTLARHLQHHGIRRVLVNTFYMPEILKEQLNRLSGLEIVYIDEDKPSGTAGGLLKALDTSLVDRDKPILIMQGDAVTDADLSFLLNTHSTELPLATIGVKHISDEEVSQMAIVVTDGVGKDGESGFVQSFKEKPAIEEVGSNRLASIGFYVLSPGVLDEFQSIGTAYRQKVGEFDYAFHFFPALLENHAQPIYACMLPQPFYWSDIGRPDQYIETVRDIYAGKLQLDLPVEKDRYFENGIIYWSNARDKSKSESAALKGNMIVFPRRI